MNKPKSSTPNEQDKSEPFPECFNPYHLGTIMTHSSQKTLQAPNRLLPCYPGAVATKREQNQNALEPVQPLSVWVVGKAVPTATSRLEATWKWGAEGSIERLGGDRNSTGRPTESTNMDPWRLPETEPLTKEHTRAGSRSPNICSICTTWSSCESPNN